MFTQVTTGSRPASRWPLVAVTGVDTSPEAAGTDKFDVTRESDVDAFLEVEIARWYHRTRVALVALLGGCVPRDYEVLSLYGWTSAAPGRATPGRVLHSDVVVCGPSSGNGRSGSAPVLCVDVAGPSAASTGLARGRAYARARVDHYWYLDPESASLETYVRSGDDFRHAETFRAAADGLVWIDFGVGVAVVALAELLELRPGRPRHGDESDRVTSRLLERWGACAGESP